MFESKAGKCVIDLLKEWQVDQIYGMPGDSLNEFMEELRKEEAIHLKTSLC